MSRLIFLICTLFCFGAALAQEVCFLGVGGLDDETIKEVFQLNEAQLENLKNWGAELEFRNEIFAVRLQRLLKEHRESPPDALLEMSYAYKALLDSIDANRELIDQRMLSTFNRQQYNLYIKLCNQLALSPIYNGNQVNE
ncbi:hypothetical protein [uncultured Croceitalea sp.]|uniref:hypothetical protein n=1 Tax=uncultured Croceitalea sp. TaxID=1798908 RepID=UPI003305B905